MFSSINAHFCGRIHCLWSSNRLILSGFSILILTGSVLAQYQKKPKKKSTKPLYTISKETTFITKPLTSDGHIDFMSAIKARYSKGVTPQNNAAVLYLQALGPNIYNNALLKVYYAKLGMKPLPKKGNYFLSHWRYMRKIIDLNAHGGDDSIKEKLEEQMIAKLDRARRQPWKAADFPHVAKWLKINEKPLESIIEGTKRNRFYIPIVELLLADDGFDVSVLLNAGSPFFLIDGPDLAAALTSRAMLNIELENFDEAWRDILACHRLARHCGLGLFALDAIWAYKIEGKADHACLVFLEKAKPNRAFISKCLRELSKLPPLADSADKVDFAERLAILDFVVLSSRYLFSGKKFIELGSGTQLKHTEAFVFYLFLLDPKWDLILETMNRDLDEAVKAMRIEDYKKRTKLIEVYDEKITMYRVMCPMDLEWPALARSFETNSKRLANSLFGLLRPGVQQLQGAEDRTVQRNRNLIVAFALAAYKSDHKKYPQKLPDLSPKYLDKIPSDLYTDKPLRYKFTKDGYLLYSLGPNGKDDGGKNGLHLKNTPDDISIEMPPRLN